MPPRLTEQQALAAHSIDHNVIVSAGAGSGKTMVLVERYLQVLSEFPESTVSDIIAVTFTRKAAEEMRCRLKSRLKDITESCPAEQKPRWQELLFQVDHARIGTIHSLCESILKAYPIEAQIDPQFEVLDDLSRADLMNAAVEQALQQAIASPTEAQLMLLEYPVESIRGWVLRQLESIPQYLSARAVMGETLDDMRRHARAVIERVKQACVAEIAADKEFRDNLQYAMDNPWPDRENNLEIRRSAIVQLAYRLLHPQADEDSGALVREIADLPSAGTAGGPKGKPLRNAISALRSRCKEVSEKAPEFDTQVDEPALMMLSALLGLVDASIENYEAAKSVAQKADYNDLIARTHRLVTEPNSNARRHFGDRIRALLVDEFQDTNRVQAELLSCLCGDKARLFMIGDDKQSIYKFQGADVSTFNHWKDLMNEGTHGLTGPSKQVDLSYSFRSHPSIVDFVNRFFSLYFSCGDNDRHNHRARHQALIPSREDAQEASRVEVILYDCMDAEEKRQSEQARAYESKAIAAWILDKIASQVEIFDKEAGATRAIGFGDFAILVQTNGDFGVIEAALAESEIPYVTFAGSGFLHRQEIYDIENMLRWIDNPEDSHALLGVLRSPFFGLNDGILHRVYTESPGGLWKSLQKSAKQPGLESLQKPLAVLRRLRQEAENSSLSDLVRKIITITSYDVVLLSMPNGKQKSRNAWKMASFVNEYNHMSCADFLNALQTMRALGVNSHTDAPLSSEAAVKLMTVHKSKGLEFPAVILPVMGRKVHLGSPKLLVHREFGIAFDTSRGKDDPRPSFHRAASVISCEMDAEEKKRLLYVAMTRARDFLAMFVEKNTRNDISFRYWLMKAAGLETDSEVASGGPLAEGEHFVTRFFDKDGIDEWSLKHAGLAGKVLNREDLLNLSEAIGFDLIAATDHPPSLTEPGVNWQSLRRVTATNTSEDLHPVIVGNLFHSAMQFYGLRLHVPDSATLDGMCGSPSINVVDPTVRQRLVAEVERLLNIFQTNSKLAEMLAGARRILPEVTYMVVKEGTMTDKRPDLIFQDESEAWHVVDFKTDRIASTDIANKVNEHSAQVSSYVTDLQKLTGASAKGWLYFAHLGVLEEIQAVSYAVTKQGQLRLPF